MLRRAAVRVVADAAVESRDRAVFVGANFACYGCVRNDVARQFDAVIGRGHFNLSAANRWKEADFVAGTQESVPSCKFAVSSRDQRGAKLA